MKITKKKLFTLLDSDEKSITLFHDSIINNYDNFKYEHLILNISGNFNIKTEDLFVFLDVSEKHREKNLSFVIIAKGIDFDELPDELIVAPTLTEAKDILEMEAIERDLGF